MKANFESEDPQEIKRIAKSSDMACFIFEIVSNSFSVYRKNGESLNYEDVMEIIRNELDNYSIDIDDLIS